MCHCTVVVMPTKFLLPGENKILLMGQKEKKRLYQKLPIAKIFTYIYSQMFKILFTNNWNF